MAYDFAESGDIFNAQSALQTDVPLWLRIEDSGRYIFDNEMPRGQPRLVDLGLPLTTAAYFPGIRVIIVEIFLQRLRIRAEMDYTATLKARLDEILAGKTEPFTPFAD